MHVVAVVVVVAAAVVVETLVGECWIHPLLPTRLVPGAPWKPVLATKNLCPTEPWKRNRANSDVLSAEVVPLFELPVAAVVVVSENRETHTR